jgi:membrane fusion protein
VPFLLSTLFWSYARIQQAPGWLTTTHGLVQIRAIRAGTVEGVSVKEGDAVTAGAIVATVRVEQAQPALGETPEAALLASLAEQQKRLEAQIELAHSRNTTESARRNDLLDGLKRERAALDEQIVRQAVVVAASWREVEAAEALAKKGFAAGRETRARRALWSEQTRDEANLRQQRAALAARIASAEADIERLPIDLEIEIARLEAERAELAQHHADIEGRRRYALVAPISGRIANLNVRKGYAVDQQKALMAIVPEGAALEAELFVPSSASAFIRPGQNVRLLYDAFPYQRFGSGSGRVTQVSQSAIAPGDALTPLALPEPVYVVRVALSDPSVTAFGDRVALKPGMMLKANVLLEERSIFEWIFEPLYAVRGRT